MKRDADSLSPAETRVMRAVIETRGGNISRIAEALHVTYQAVANTLSVMYDKLQGEWTATGPSRHWSSGTTVPISGDASEPPVCWGCSAPMCSAAGSSSEQCAGPAEDAVKRLNTS